MGSKIVKVQTGAGVLRVTQRVNADNEFTGRVDGITYVGPSWAAVVAQLRAAYTDQRVWTKYLVVSAHDPADDEHHHFPDDTNHARAEIRYRTIEATQVLVSDGVSGVWTRDSETARPWFVREATSAEAAIGGDDSGVMVWTPELEEEVERLRLAVQELARRLYSFVKGKDLAKRLLAGGTVLALPSGDPSPRLETKPGRKR